MVKGAVNSRKYAVVAGSLGCVKDKVDFVSVLLR